jgi:hypothetical protein
MFRSRGFEQIRGRVTKKHVVSVQKTPLETRVQVTNGWIFGFGERRRQDTALA